MFQFLYFCSSSPTWSRSSKSFCKDKQDQQLQTPQTGPDRTTKQNLLGSVWLDKHRYELHDDVQELLPSASAAGRSRLLGFLSWSWLTLGGKKQHDMNKCSYNIYNNIIFIFSCSFINHKEFDSSRNKVSRDSFSLSETLKRDSDCYEAPASVFSIHTSLVYRNSCRCSPTRLSVKDHLSAPGQRGCEETNSRSCSRERNTPAPHWAPERGREAGNRCRSPPRWRHKHSNQLGWWTNWTDTCTISCVIYICHHEYVRYDDRNLQKMNAASETFI